jgi:hypothetical protein
MTNADATAIRQGARSLLNRAAAAQQNFVEWVMEQTGCTEAEAEKVLRIYKKERLMKIDSYMGTWHIKHGAFLDVDVLRRAIEIEA